ncbi:putative monooxygenase (salicylate/ hydroxybenzoate hydroxylase [Streptomyces albiflavescens]|uniref:Monooxygenase (salicylate/ hydroxybenzoate hydroxylase) n=1 Tax=Streptomyces albiflavescens TaxID=1623582 RepID=A0A917Y863_9ACTN|nr:3-hydroxybenzoate 6-monooxygenase [Streptomyces albiflavescens]GGN74870.1 putative monooxygenase (salicylate/ hydroxybenzoate hydroxylase [Streptomyces albiflavescens]
MTHILVAGGGIGGLAVALGQARSGHRVTVLESRPEFSEIGAGIQLAPNAFHALDALGVRDAVADRADFIDELRFMDGTTGHRVAAMLLTGGYRTRFGNPYAVVHRADLHRALLDGCRESGVELIAGQRVTRYEHSDGHVTATTATGDRFRGQALIGADGLRSAVREQLVGDGAPRVSGHTIYRSVIPMSEVPERLRTRAVTLWAGPKWHFVHYPIGTGAYLNLAATRDDGAVHEITGTPAPRERVLAEFDELSDAARQVLQLGRDWRIWVLCDRDPVETWVDGRVALAGDAAHPMLQYAAQGACMALEDAVVLAALLRCDPADVSQRLEKYNGVRRERTARTTLTARWMGSELYHAAGARAAERDALLASHSAEDLYDVVSWLHGATDFTTV